MNTKNLIEIQPYSSHSYSINDSDFPVFSQYINLPRFHSLPYICITIFSIMFYFYIKQVEILSILLWSFQTLGQSVAYAEKAFLLSTE